MVSAFPVALIVAGLGHIGLRSKRRNTRITPLSRSPIMTKTSGMLTAFCAGLADFYRRYNRRTTAISSRDLEKLLASSFDFTAWENMGMQPTAPITTMHSLGSLVVYEVEPSVYQLARKQTGGTAAPFVLLLGRHGSSVMSMSAFLNLLLRRTLPDMSPKNLQALQTPDCAADTLSSLA